MLRTILAESGKAFVSLGPLVQPWNMLIYAARSCPEVRCRCTTLRLLMITHCRIDFSMCTVNFAHCSKFWFVWYQGIHIWHGISRYSPLKRLFQTAICVRTPFPDHCIAVAKGEPHWRESWPDGDSCGVCTYEALLSKSLICGVGWAKPVAAKKS